MQALRLREREGHTQWETRANLPKSYAQCYDAMQRLAREAAHGIMYLEQEVEKIRRLVIINNPRLLVEQLASLRPQWRWHRFTGQLYRMSKSTYNNDDKASFSTRSRNNFSFAKSEIKTSIYLMFQKHKKR